MRGSALRIGFSWAARSTMLACCAFVPPFATAASPPAQLVPGTELEVRLDADATAGYVVDLPEGTAADLELTQRGGFVDLELRDDTGGVLDVRTEAGVDGHIEAPLLASAARRWDVVISARKGKGSATLRLRLSSLHPATQIDGFKGAAFEHYVRAEQLRRANYRETVVTRRAADTDERTRAAYTAAETQYAAAGDGCGQRRALTGLSRMEEALGNHVQARNGAEAALMAGCIGDPAEQAQAFKTIGMAADYQGDFAASAGAGERALALYEQTGDQRYQGIVLGNLSAVYMALGATDRALGAANGSLRAAESTADGQGIVFSRKSIAAIHLARGELASALQEYRHTLEDLAVTPYPMIEGETWNDLGIVYHRMADYPESLKAFARAQIVWQKMSNRVGEADTLIDKAQALLELGAMHRASNDFRRALTIASADGLKSAATRALRGLGSASLALRQPGAARRYFTKSLDIARATGEITAQSYALRALGDVDFQQGRSAGARRDDELALDLARKAADRDGEAATLVQLAREVGAGGDLAAARKYIDEALAIVERQRGQIQDPSLRTSYFASMRAYPDAEIDILMRLDRRFPGKGYALSALAAAERARARSLQDMFAERSIELSRSLAPQLAEAQHAAEERLSTAAFQFGRLRPDAGAEQRRTLANAVDAASRALDEVRGSVHSANPRYADLVQPAALDVGEIQRTLLADDTAVLEYWLGSRKSYVWIVTRDAFRVVRLADRASIERFAGDLATLLRAPASEAPGNGFDALAAAESRQTQAIDRVAAGLAAEVIGEEVLRGLPRKIAIVADGALQETPFGILPTRMHGRSLGTTHDLSYLPSITTLKWLRRTAQKDELPAALAVFAAPILEPLAASAHEAVPGLAPLAYSRLEAESIAAFLPRDHVWLALGADASRDNALTADWRRYSIVHFATHAIVDRRRPELSGIVLSLYDPTGRPQDGLLRMNDIYNLDMPVDLVVLSGCDTAAGRSMDSEGVLSLSRAFLYAGARRVVASLWPVEDRATAAFMREFYRGLLVEHMPAATALRFSQQHIARDNRWASPYYWAGFVLQGDWD
jgi:CHAT domain-containing protein/tetratricopeptide (TPR) repeat protein